MAWVDAARGAALGGMLVYHAAWDLHAFGVSRLDPSLSAGWRSFGHAVAAAFLLLSGVSLSLAHRRGGTIAQGLRRLVRLGLAAAAVTGVTVLVSPAAPVWFGILHCILVTNLCALPLIEARRPVLLGLAGSALVLPLAITLPIGAGWAWSGLTAAVPASLDFRPVLPWLGVVLAGVVLGRSASPGLPPAGDARRPAGIGRGLGALEWGGRHSLALYLIHQPLLVGGLMLALGTGWPAPQTVRLSDPGQAKAFLGECRSTCGLAGGEPELCRSTCHCVLTRALSRPRGEQTSSAVGQEDFAAAVAACRPVSGR